ncbi:MAG: FAD-dependent oxidoreductase [Leptolyngbyaceae cyanobacterium SL_1_1]|nr:FAD-dependent oxidoreductase [Leptolyngbyaceae cyanobacterium RM1_1_2]NJO09376.1 FAD-dependent oxidoreductase [Leptolyngbyaceae cyanobacterium SL_1_1]
MKARVIVIGCGVVGATIAYELSQVPQLEVWVCDRQPPARGATGAALGVLMGIISHKVKGRSWQLREASLRRYETLIPELERLTGKPILYNQQGIVSLCFGAEEVAKWEQLQQIRQAQGWPLEIWSPQQVKANCTALNIEAVQAAVYSPRDRQIDPTALTLALVEASRIRGVTFKFGCEVQAIAPADVHSCLQIQTTTGAIAADWVVVSAGLGSSYLAGQTLALMPVLGQAIRLQAETSLGDPGFQPVINGRDIHLVPLGGDQYWVGATVEFPAATDDELKPEAERLSAVLQGAIAYCPALAQSKVLQTWSGLRPRPQGRPAPVIEQISPSRIILATGHYRNGVLLAPATAQQVRQLIGY